MLFICLYHGDLYSDMWKGDLYFRPPTKKMLKWTKRGTLSLANLRLKARTGKEDKQVNK